MVWLMKMHILGSTYIKWKHCYEIDQIYVGLEIIFGR